MLLTYSLNKEDYLEYFLYNSSTNEKTKAKRRRNWLLLSLSFIFLTIIVFIENYEYLKIPLTLLTLATVTLYPFYEKWQFKKYYTNYIDDNFSKRLNTASDLLINDTQIILTDKTGETKLNKSELTEIIETGKYFYIGMSTGGHILIPKYRLENITEIEKATLLLSSEYKIPFKKDLNWRWK